MKIIKRLIKSKSIVITGGKTFSTVTIFISFLFFSSFFPTPYPLFSQQKIILKCATVAPENSDWGKASKTFSQEIASQTQGELEIVWYFSGVVGDEPEIAKALRDGKLDCAALTGHGLSYVILPMRVVELPFLFRSHDEMNTIRKEISSLLARISGEYNIRLFALINLGSVHVFSKTPIAKLEDVKDKTFWVWKGDYLAEFMGNVIKSSLGAKPFPLPLYDVINQIQSLDFVYNVSYALVTLGWQRHIKYYITHPLTFSFAAVIVRKDVFDKLPQKYQGLIETKIRKFSEDVTQMNKTNNEKSFDLLHKMGARSITFQDSEIERVENLFKDQVWTPLKDKMYPSWLLAEILVKLAQYRAQAR